MTKPLAKLRVIECGTLIAGPFAGRLLADLGAEVIKVELPGQGDPMREWGHHRFNGRTLWWPTMSRNKKCITIDLRKTQGQALLLRLAEQADMLIENFRPGTMERWGLGPEDLKSINPGLVMVRVSGFGQTGPYSQKAGFGAIGEAMGGLRYVSGYADRPPTRIGISIGDSLAALFGVIGALTAVYYRDHNEQAHGQVVDVAIYEAVFAMMESALSEYTTVGVTRERTGSVLKNVAPSNLYKTSDGFWVLIAANADNVFRRLAPAVGRPDLLEDPRYADHQARGENMESLDAIIEHWTKHRSRDEILRIMDEAGVPAGPLYTMADIAADPHYQDREMIVTVEDPHLGELKMQGVVPKLSLTPGSIDWTGPELGEHNEEIFKGLLGLSDEEYLTLQQEQVI
jgi:succinyl-CoA--D-citramalate CoA-transferase